VRFYDSQDGVWSANSSMPRRFPPVSGRWGHGRAHSGYVRRDVVRAQQFVIDSATPVHL
jgi:hypothetical protein